MAGLPPEIETVARHLVEMLRGEALKYVKADALPDIRLEAAAIDQVIDPANGLPGYEGVWRNRLNERVGKLIFNSDGSYYAEFDLCVRHPLKPGLFVEAVTAWGRGDKIKAEARLLPVIQEPVGLEQSSRAEWESEDSFSRVRGA